MSGREGIEEDRRVRPGQEADLASRGQVAELPYEIQADGGSRPTAKLPSTAEAQ